MRHALALLAAISAFPGSAHAVQTQLDLVRQVTQRSLNPVEAYTGAQIHETIEVALKVPESAAFLSHFFSQNARKTDVRVLDDGGISFSGFVEGIDNLGTPIKVTISKSGRVTLFSGFLQKALEIPQHLKSPIGATEGQKIHAKLVQAVKSLKKVNIVTNRITGTRMPEADSIEILQRSARFRKESAARKAADKASGYGATTCNHEVGRTGSSGGPFFDFRSPWSFRRPPIGKQPAR